MSIDMYLGDSQNQAFSASSVVTAQNNGYESLRNALNAFSTESPSLSGKAYDSAKNYCSSILIPLTKACILLNDAIKTSIRDLPAKYISEVDSVSLKESDLRDMIRRASDNIKHYNSLIEKEYASDEPDEAYIYRLERQLSNQRDTKKKLEEKLEKLLTFSSNSPNIFKNIESLKNAVDQGISQAKNSWNPSSQTFVIPSKDKMGWTNDIELAWKSRLPQKPNDGEDVVIKKAEEDYKNGLISLEDLHNIKNALITGGVAFLVNAGTQLLSDSTAKYVADTIVKVLENSPAYNLLAGGAALTTNGTIATIPIRANPEFVKAVGKFAKHGAPIIGAAIDFGMQVSNGEDVTNAAIKTGGHVAIGIGAAKVGAMAGTAIGGPLGTVVGGVVGFGIGVIGSMVFDSVYDKFAKPIVNDIVKKVDEGLDKIGDAVGGFFKGIFG